MQWLFIPGSYFKCFTYINSFSPLLQPYEIVTIIIPILQMKNLR